MLNLASVRATVVPLGLLHTGVHGPLRTYLAIVGVAGALGLTAALTAASPSATSMPTLLLLAIPFVALIVGNLRMLLLGGVLLELPFQLDKHFNYREELAALGGLGGLGVSTSTVALIALYAIWLASLLSGVGRAARPDFRASLPPALYLACVVASLFVARDLEASTFELMLLAQMFLLYLYVVSTVRTRKDVVFVVVMLVLGLLLESLLMAGQRFGGERFSLPGRVVVAELGQAQYERIAGTVGGANAASAYLSFMLAPAAALMLAAASPWAKRLAASAFVLGTLALFLTLTRGGWIAFGVSMSLLALLACRRGWLSPAVPLSALALTFPLVFVFQDLIQARLMAEDGGSAQSRFPLMNLALRIIKDHPLLGIGANNFAIVMPDYLTPDFSPYGGAWLYVVHNKYLLVWAEVGLVGLVAFMGFLLTTLWLGWRGFQLNDRLLSPIALGFVVAIIGHMAHMWADVFVDRPMVETLWLASAVLVAITKIRVDAADQSVADRARLSTSPGVAQARALSA